MKKVKNLSLILITLLFGVLSSISMIPYFDDTIKFIPPDTVPDTSTAFFLGGYLFAVFGTIFNIAMILIFSLLLFINKKDISILLWKPSKSERVSVKITRIICYAITALFIFSGINDLITYRELILSGVIYYILTIIVSIMYSIIILSLLQKSSSIQ